MSFVFHWQCTAAAGYESPLLHHNWKPIPIDGKEIEASPVDSSRCATVAHKNRLQSGRRDRRDPSDRAALRVDRNRSNGTASRHSIAAPATQQSNAPNNRGVDYTQLIKFDGLFIIMTVATKRGNVRYVTTLTNQCVSLVCQGV